MSDEKEYQQKLEEMSAAEKQHQAIMDVLNDPDFDARLEARIKAMQDEADAKRKAFDESGKFEVVMQYVREQFANGRTLIWDEDIAYSQEPLPFDHNDFRHTLDTLVENVEREEIEDAMFDTTHWACGEFLVEEVFGQGSLYGILPIAEKAPRLAHITREWDLEEE